MEHPDRPTEAFRRDGAPRQPNENFPPLGIHDARARLIMREIGIAAQFVSEFHADEYCCPMSFRLVKNDWRLCYKSLALSERIQDARKPEKEDCQRHRFVDNGQRRSEGGNFCRSPWKGRCGSRE